MIDDDFYRRYRRQIEAIYHHTEGHVDRTRIANELRRYMEEYGIDIKTACESIARKWAFYDEEEHRPRFVLDPGDPPPSFALDALEADIFTSLLTRARHKTVAKYMKELGYDEKEYEEIIWHDQARNPFCDRIDNQGYMESVAWSVENCGLDPLPDGSIKLDSIDNFVKSLSDNGLIEIIET